MKGKTAVLSAERTCASHMEDSQLNASDGLFAVLQLFLTFLVSLLTRLGLGSKEITTYSQNKKIRKERKERLAS